MQRTNRLQRFQSVEMEERDSLPGRECTHGSMLSAVQLKQNRHGVGVCQGYNLNANVNGRFARRCATTFMAGRNRLLPCQWPIVVARRRIMESGINRERRIAFSSILLSNFCSYSFYIRNMFFCTYLKWRHFWFYRMKMQTNWSNNRDNKDCNLILYSDCNLIFIRNTNQSYNREKFLPRIRRF